MSPCIPVLLTARDPAIVEAVEASALALDVPLRVVHHSDELARWWPHAPLRLVAPDMSGRVARLGAHPRTVLVGRDSDELAAASSELGVPVVLLPQGSTRLAELLARAVQVDEAGGLLVAVTGASGGLGTSTLALAMALRPGSGRASCAVELAAHGGGLDLLAGAEGEEGTRWAELAEVRGSLGDLAEALPRCRGVPILPLSRERPGMPTGEARDAVLDALRRTADVVVVDCGDEPLAVADVRVLVVGADVRSVAAARMLVAETGVPPTGIVVRTGRARRLTARAVAESLDAALLGELREDRALPRLAELGQPPVAPPARRLRKDVATIWGAIHG